MKRTIKKVTVVGSGIMGSGIACHFANIGLEVLLLDIVPNELTEIETKKGLIIRKKNPDDGRGVLIYLTDLGKQMREQSKITVLKFNEVVKQNISEEKFQHFMEVTDIINELITEKKIF